MCFIFLIRLDTAKYNISVNIGNLILWENVNIKKDDEIMKNIFRLFFKNSHAESLFPKKLLRI